MLVSILPHQKGKPIYAADNGRVIFLDGRKGMEMLLLLTMVGRIIKTIPHYMRINLDEL